jgi:hypothetical protein
LRPSRAALKSPFLIFAESLHGLEGAHKSANATRELENTLIGLADRSDGEGSHLNHHVLLRHRGHPDQRDCLRSQKT